MSSSYFTSFNSLLTILVDILFSLGSDLETGSSVLGYLISRKQAKYRTMSAPLPQGINFSVQVPSHVSSD
jgi:hypothetical protein